MQTFPITAKPTLTAMAALALVLLGACGSAPASGPAPSQPADHPAGLTVARLDPLHQTEDAFAVTISDSQTIQAIHDKLVKLPEFPKGVVHCPADNGVQYELTFDSRYGDDVAEVNATGCQTVKIGDRSYWALEPQGNEFRQTLEQALGLTDAEFAVGFAAH